MGGDHKCPVCSATFTRPQHVARHMRSHTGDRPYKCQFCGDQFARSDLLARHVNKCHANEKPLLPAGGTRRRGSASTSRATTSKQACDQCVQNSLPCDGCNPCSKCVQRKIRCTFVKFHRQTAPAGPGHQPQSSPDLISASSSISSLSSSASTSRLVPPYSSSRDDFHLSPPPLTVPSMGSSSGLFPETSFSFPPIYPDPPPQPIIHTHREPRAMSAGEPSDFSSRYRARADLLRRTGEQVGLGASNGGHGFSEIRSSSVWSAGAGATRDAAGWNLPRFNQDQRHLPHPHPFQLNEGTPGYRRYSMGTSRRPGYDLDVDFSDGSSSSIHSSSGGSDVGIGIRLREGFRSSDATYGGHPPPPGSSHSQQFHPSSSFPNTTLTQHSPTHNSAPIPTTLPPNLTAPTPSTSDTFDESVFGALSLEDPALLATDAPPFFSSIPMGSEDPGLTPTPAQPNAGGGATAGSGVAGGTVAEGDGELWRAFMRNTPVEQGQPPQGPNQGQGQGQGMGLPLDRRSSSAYSQPYPPYPSQHQRTSPPPPQLQFQIPPPQSRFSQSAQQPRYQEEQRPDDLLCYQAAVLAHARETQPVLREPPPSRRGTIDTSQLLSAEGPGSARSRPGSAGSTASTSTTSSTTSSLAGVFGDGTGRHGTKRGLAGALSGMGDDGPESKRRGAVSRERGT